jgi:hypothetical protein
VDQEIHLKIFLLIVAHIFLLYLHILVLKQKEEQDEFDNSVDYQSY